MALCSQPRQVRLSSSQVRPSEPAVGVAYGQAREDADMPDDTRNNPSPRRGGASRRRGGLPPWLIPDAPRQWWSAPARQPRVRIVDHAPSPAPDTDLDPARRVSPPALPQAPAPPPMLDERRPAIPAPRRPPPLPPQSPPPPDDDKPSVLIQVRRWLRGERARQLASSTLARLAALCLLLVGLALVGQVVTRLPWLHSAGSPHAPVTTAPMQTELDGVITLTNLDPQVPFEGDISVTAHDGAWYCRNAPLPHSTWHVQLAGGQTISLACIVPASTPSFLPPHTFRRAVPDAAGTGLALVDNPDSFRGVALLPTAAATH